jgi:2-oxoglutarate dehydrogenase E2 component (dihydrolipoamide succinyltransferase)
MSQNVKIELPKLGESIHSATVVQWLKNVGDKVALDEALLEVSTDKVNSEIPSPVAGILKEILVQVDQEVEVGAPLAIVEVAGSQSVKEEKVEVKATNEQKSESGSSMQDYFSPAVLQLARKEGISIDELSKISSSGFEGRITKRDVEEYIAKKRSSSECPHRKVKEVQEPPVSSDATVSKVKITGLRKAIADAMIKSYNEIPHAALINEIDVTELMKFIAEEKDAFLKQQGYKLTLTSFIAKAIALATVQYPLLNASVDGNDTIIVKHAVNVGVAVGVEMGVIVPVIKHCERKNVTMIAKEVSDLAVKTRNSKLAHEDVLDGTITLTNFGMTGTRAGFPIIRHPEVAIIGVGAVQKRVMALSDDSIGIRQMMDLTLCFDHRVIDGLYGCGFINAIKEHLQHPKALMQQI